MPKIQFENRLLLSLSPKQTQKAGFIKVFFTIFKKSIDFLTKI